MAGNDSIPLADSPSVSFTESDLNDSEPILVGEIKSKASNDSFDEKTEYEAAKGQKGAVNRLKKLQSEFELAIDSTWLQKIAKWLFIKYCIAEELESVDNGSPVGRKKKSPVKPKAQKSELRLDADVAAQIQQILRAQKTSDKAKQQNNRNGRRKTIVRVVFVFKTINNICVCVLKWQVGIETMTMRSSIW